MTHSPTRRIVLLAVPALAATGMIATAAPALAESTTVVISEAYGGGGNSGAPLRSDFVELFNRGTSNIDLTGWSLHYWSASGTSITRTALSGHIAPGRHFLVQQASGANTSAAALPTPDVTGTTAMSATGARVTVVNSSGQVVDLLGWGQATQFEGAAADATNNTTSIARSNPCKDTDNNSADFVLGAPTPQNSTAPAISCTSTPPGDPTDPGNPGEQTATIAQIQGRSHTSPYDGKQVNAVTGVVTATNRTGFWMQSLTPDDDPATSEGLYVYTRTAPAVSTGHKVSVDGTVAEFRPGGSSGKNNLTTTQITSPTVTVTGTADLPAPVVIGVDRTAPPQTITADNPGSVEDPSHQFRPETNAIDFYESLEGMRVAVRDARVVGPTTRHGEIAVLPGTPAPTTRSSFGGVVYGSYGTPNAGRLQLDDAIVSPMPKANVGDTLAADTVGVLDYSFANYKLQVTAAPTVTPGGATREVTAPQSPDQLSVATFNVENLNPTNPQEKFDRLAGQIVTNLRSPDILALEEIQDNNGAQDDGTVDSTTTVRKLTDAITAAGGPGYEARWINPEDKADGGQPGGNIRQVLLHRADRGIELTDLPEGDATTAVGVTGRGKQTHLTHNPGRIAPDSPAWRNSRKPLAGEYRFRGQSVFVVANHFASKCGDQPLFGQWQQPIRSSEEQRHQQAREVRSFVEQVQAADAEAKIVVLGDINDFEFSTTTDILVGNGSMIDLPRTLTPTERWTYVYEGNSQVLDHILISKALTVTPKGAKGAAFDYDIVHTNSAFHDQDSDHDPQVVRLTLRGGS